MTNIPVLQLENIEKTYPLYKQPQGLTIFNNIDLVLYQGQLVALTGPSGCGKSSLLHICGLLDTPNHGTIKINGQDVTHASRNIRSKLRGQYLGFVYQFHHLLPEFTALENVMMPLIIQGSSKEDAHQKSFNLLQRIGLEERIHHRPSQLSGGEKQRTAIARALVNDPKILLADEPTGNLDPETAEQVLTLFLEIAMERKVAALIATHNMELAARMHRTILFKDQHLVEQ